MGEGQNPNPPSTRPDWAASPIGTAEQRANRAAQPLTRAAEVLNGSEQFDDDVIRKPVDSVFPSFRAYKAEYSDESYERAVVNIEAEQGIIKSQLHYGFKATTHSDAESLPQVSSPPTQTPWLHPAKSLPTNPTPPFQESINNGQTHQFAFGEKLPILEIVAVSGQSDGKNSLLEALLGLRINIRNVEMGTRRPLILQMIHDPTTLEPRCWFQGEDSEDYGSPLILVSAIADVIKSRTEALLKSIKSIVSSKPIVMRAEYAHCLNLTIIDEEKFRPHIGFFGLRDYLESELQKRYKEAAPATIALLEQRCNEVTDELAKMDSKIQATYDVAHLRRSAMLHTTLICNDVGAVIDGAVDPAPEQGGNNKRGTVREWYLEQA
ncbi:hypothetical protein U1Q18_029097 [Sarracenia purpurea var. burkii]